MVYTKLTKTAIDMCLISYGKDTDGTLPLLFLAYHRASKLNEEHEICASLLSVGIEYKKLNLNHLKKKFPFEVTDALFILTKDDTLSYPDYIRRIKTNEIATKVKIIELEHKLELLELQKDKQIYNQQKDKYNFALKILK